MSAIAEVIKSRVSANSYDTERSLTIAQITALVDLATHAPSAFNLQNWKFLAVHSTQAKARLFPLAFGQQKVVDAAVTFIVCGTLNPHLTLPDALKPTLDAGIIDQSVYDMWVGAAQGMYKGKRSIAARRSHPLWLTSRDDPDVGRQGPRPGFDADDRVRSSCSGQGVWAVG